LEKVFSVKSYLVEEYRPNRNEGSCLGTHSILYAATEIKPIYGHRQGYADYTSLDSIIFPNQELDGWLRFDIPVAAEWGEMFFVFIPESAQVGVSYSSPNYPYADDKPTYVWNCAP
jgi:hypothetical protein